MNLEDFNKFAEEWYDAHEIMAGGKVFSNRAMAKIFDTFEEYPLAYVSKAITIHRKQSKFAPTPNDIIEIIRERTGNKPPSADEAWSIALMSFDERLPAILTSEILEAKAGCQAIYDSGDKIGARMAFREAYNRLIGKLEPVKWFLSPGDDKELNSQAIKDAVLQGKIKLSKTLQETYLIPAPTTTTQKLIEQANRKSGNVDTSAAISVIKSILDIDDNNGIALRELQRKDFEEHRREVIEKAEIKLNEEIL